MKKFIFLGLILGAVGLYAAASSADDIVYPVVELGSCQNKEECYNYCNDPAHIEACLEFAARHNLASEEEIEMGRKFKDAIVSGQTPGGCTTPDSCEAYCNDITHIDECLNFAESAGISDEHVEEGRKLSAYLQSGGQMPGSCTSHESCEAYCSDFNHIDECLDFADQIGISIRDEIRGEEISSDQIRRVVQLMKEGRTPGGCTSREDCEAYCSDNTHFEECVSFAEEMGFLNEEEAEVARQSGGTGPGGCSSRESCEAFCNDPANHEVCFQFAQEHGILTEENRQELEQGMQFLREAPPEMLDCLQREVGTEIVEELKAGTLTPGQDIRERIEICMGAPGEGFTVPDESNHLEEGGFNQPQPPSLDQIFNGLPGEVAECARGKVGDQPSQETLEAAIRECYQNIIPHEQQSSVFTVFLNLLLIL